MSTNPLLRLHALGQRVWLDYIRRAILDNGTLACLIRDDRVSGVTSNPAIFHRAMTQHEDYDRAMDRLFEDGAAPMNVYETLALEDIRRAADLFLGEYQRSQGRDGFVSLEVSPALAHDTNATLSEARRLWALLDRPNVMVKVPATRAGLPAIRQLTAEGLNINVTLLFSVDRYAQVAEAFLSGLEDRVAVGLPIETIASVASFFLSRIDTFVDGRLDAHADPGAQALRGKAAIACAQLAYQHYRTLVSDPRWLGLAARGARSQRLLWASTSAKDPAYGELKYVEGLIASDTVSTMPPATLNAYRRHGQPAIRIEDRLEEAYQLPLRLGALGIDLGEVAEALEHEGVQKFADPFAHLLAALEWRRRAGHA